MSVGRATREEELLRLGGVVCGSTLALTTSFFGVVALLTGQAVGVVGRLPLYVLALAATFVGALVVVERRGHDGRTVLRAATAAAAGNFAVAGLASEGLVFALRHPGQVVSSQLFAYVLSAGLIATGLGFWFANHRDEVAFAPGDRL